MLLRLFCLSKYFKGTKVKIKKKKEKKAETVNPSKYRSVSQ